MKFSNLCLGCGCLLTDEKNSKNLCFRCFQLKNYNRLIEDESLIGNADNYLDELDDESSNIYLVTDLFSLSHDIDFFVKKNIKKLNIIINKMDLLPRTFNFKLTDELIKKTLILKKIKIQKVFYTSIYNKEILQNLNKYFCEHNRFPNVLIGYSDVGKSSLINALLKLNNIDNQLCLSSCYINTTNTVKLFEFPEYNLVDYPGIYDKGNILNYLTPNDVKKVIEYKYSRPYQLQIYQSQRIYIENIAIIDIILKDHQKSTISMYLSPTLKIKRKNLSENINENNLLATVNYDGDCKWKKHEFIINPNAYKTNFNIYGLGLLVIHKGAANVTIKVNENVSVERLPFALI